MSRSLIDILWAEFKEYFYREHSARSTKELDVAWMEYQIRLIKESQK